MLISYATSQLYAFLEETIEPLSAFRALQTNKQKKPRQKQKQQQTLENQKGCLQAVLFPKYSFKKNYFEIQKSKQ